jgi:hypothetical protein
VKIVDALMRLAQGHERQTLIARKPYDDGLVDLARLIDDVHDRVEPTTEVKALKDRKR